MQSRNLDPLLQWIDRNYGELVSLSGEITTEMFHFQLHKARFLQEREDHGMPRPSRGDHNA